MSYKELQITCGEEATEILIAELGLLGYDSMLENTKGFHAYIPSEQFEGAAIEALSKRYSAELSFDFQIKDIAKENWNETWEKNYDPILVDDRCIVKASFHRIEEHYPYEIIINPKMSFGTGHHETTHLMLSRQMELDHEGKKIMDAGCGTGILAIMAAKRGAKSVEAFDIDPWCVENGAENILLNGVDTVHLQLGKIEELSFEGKFDIILANINKNVLLNEMHRYQKYLAKDGLLLISGFYEEDVEDLVAAADPLGLKPGQQSTRNGWTSLSFTN